MTEIVEQIKEALVKTMDIPQGRISERPRKQLIRRIVEEIIEVVKEVHSAWDRRSSKNAGHGMVRAAGSESSCVFFMACSSSECCFFRVRRLHDYENYSSEK